MSNEGTKLKEACSFVMPFGKHEGESIEEISVDDPKYLEWIDENWEPCDILTKVRKFLEE